MKQYLFSVCSRDPHQPFSAQWINERYAADGYTIHSIVPLTRGSGTMFSTPEVLVCMEKDVEPPVQPPMMPSFS